MLDTNTSINLRLYYIRRLKSGIQIVFKFDLKLVRKFHLQAFTHRHFKQFTSEYTNLTSGIIIIWELSDFL